MIVGWEGDGDPLSMYENVMLLLDGLICFSLNPPKNFISLEHQLKLNYQQDNMIIFRIFLFMVDILVIILSCLYIENGILTSKYAKPLENLFSEYTYASLRCPVINRY